MISAELLDTMLEVWARWSVGDGGLRRLWYPSRSAAMSQAPIPGSLSQVDLDPDYLTTECAMRVDRELSVLKTHNTKWFYAITTFYSEAAPDEMKAQSQRVSLPTYRARVYQAKQWLRRRL